MNKQLENPFWVLNIASGMKMSEHKTIELAAADADQLSVIHKQVYTVVNVVPVYITSTILT